VKYGFHPAAEVEHLEQIAFYESRLRGLGARYRDHFLKTITNICEASTAYPFDHAPDIRRDPASAFPVDHYLSRARGKDSIDRGGALPAPSRILVRAYSLIE